jgi:hypothetical protein
MGGGGGGVQETADQVQEQKNNTELWNYSQTVYKPFIDKYIAKETGNAASKTEASKAAGQVNAEVMKGVGSGIDPRQPNAVGMTQQGDTAAGIKAEATVSAEGKVKQRQMGSLQNIVDIGRGQQTTANQTQEGLAGESVRSAIQEKEAELKSQAVTENAIGSAVGTAAALGGRMMGPNVATDDDYQVAPLETPNIAAGVAPSNSDRILRAWAR